MSVDSLSEVSSDVSDEGNTPLCAVPPEIRREEKSHRHEVGSSPAYQCLEEVKFTAFKILNFSKSTV